MRNYVPVGAREWRKDNVNRFRRQSRCMSTDLQTSKHASLCPPVPPVIYLYEALSSSSQIKPDQSVQTLLSGIQVLANYDDVFHNRSNSSESASRFRCRTATYRYCDLAIARYLFDNVRDMAVAYVLLNRRYFTISAARDQRSIRTRIERGLAPW